MKRRAIATWKGGPRAGEGTVSTGSGTFQNILFTAGTSTDGFPCTCPSEMLAAAAASCVSLMVARELALTRIPADHVTTTADVEIVETPGGWKVTGVQMKVAAAVEGVDERIFHDAIERARGNCAISNALQVPIKLEVDIATAKAAD